MTRVEIEINPQYLKPLLEAVDNLGGEVKRVIDPKKSDRKIARDQEQEERRREMQASIVQSLEKGFTGLDGAFGLRDYTRNVMLDHSDLTRKVIATLAVLTETNDHPVAIASEIAGMARQTSNKVSSIIGRVVDEGLVSVVPHPTNRRLQYSISDPFLMTGLLLNNNPQEWGRQFEAGMVHKALGAKIAT